MKIIFFILWFFLINQAYAWQRSTISYAPAPLEMLGIALTDDSRAPAAKSEEFLNHIIDQEESNFIERRIYYYDPQSGATCLGVEGENECLEP